jgi:osmotically-inducible protein OsmY
MALSAAVLILPASEPAGDQIDVAQAKAAPPAQCLDEPRLTERVESALRATGYGALRSIEVTVHSRLVILRGHVPTYYLKQVAQTAALAVPGEHHVRNDVTVARPG